MGRAAQVTPGGLGACVQELWTQEMHPAKGAAWKQLAFRRCRAHPASATTVFLFW